ncbi:hypothetical protein PoB_001960100 [Plakobranchus ocellatus]|uniref:Uncharacterized protein n=1 Tax=Plakobranchus ocellatus TaxID=259542 RepID=A0AAV3Z1A7_9GAST|nr:hypothetical protein PoB_001960100 [Plakobranchus ocellatus]
MLRGQTNSTKYSPTWEEISAKEVKEKVENGRRHALDDRGRHVDLEEDVGANETQLAQSNLLPSDRRRRVGKEDMDGPVNGLLVSV